MNRYNRIHNGHYEPWLVENIQRLRVQLMMDSASARVMPLCSLDLKISGETFGITAFPTELSQVLSISMVDHHCEDNVEPVDERNTLLSMRLSTHIVFQAGSTRNSPRKMYSYLAEKQHTMYAVVPVHTSDEFGLFRRMMTRVQASTVQLDWTKLTKTWNNDYADGATIFYKTPDHLKAHFNIYCDRQNARDSMMASSGICDTMRQHLQSPGRAHQIIRANTPSPLSIPAVSAIQMNSIGISTTVIQQDNQTTVRHLQSITRVPGPSLSMQPRINARGFRNIAPRPMNTVSHPHPPPHTSKNYRQTQSSRLPLPKKSTRVCICKDPSCKGSSRRSRCKNYARPSE